MRRSADVGLVVLAVVSLSALALPPTVTASTAYVFSGELTYEADPNEQNDVTMSFGDGKLTITEASITIIAADGCVQQTASQVSCSSPRGITAITVLLGDLDDEFMMLTAGPPGATVGVVGMDGADTLIGGPGAENLFGFLGNDTLTGGGGNDVIRGGGEDGPGPDDDEIDGGPGNDVLNGQLGDDTVLGGPGEDRLEPASAGRDGDDTIGGGPGRDRLDYSRRSGPLTVTLDDRAGDGESGEQDNVGSDVEDVTSGAGGDILLGSALDNDLDGGSGDDVILGGGGRDSLRGGVGDSGSDTLDGGDGDDTGSGGPGDDALFGRTGGDTLDGGGGADTLDGGDHGDELLGGAGIDSVRGGDGPDSLRGGAPALVGADGGDTLKGDGGDDRLAGDAGDDTLDGGIGADAIAGGDDTDTVDYRSRFESIVVTLDDIANDGAPGERDNVATDVEDILGGRFNDTLSGDSSSNSLEGGGGEDYADGARGPDALSGDDSGDVLRTRDGVTDRIACGSGHDLVIADPKDRVGGDCDSVDTGRRRRPRLGRTAVIRPVEGILAMSPSGIRRFVPLKDRVNLPLGAELDARKGEVLVRTAGRRGRSQRATFSAGMFRVLQRRTRRPITRIAMKGGSFRRCRRGRRARQGAGVSARHRRLARRVVRRLRGSARGRFRTDGRHSSATVRGTTWEVLDRCDGTLTRVFRGRVAVRDFRRKRTIVLRAGQRYLARAP